MTPDRGATAGESGFGMDQEVVGDLVVPGLGLGTHARHGDLAIDIVSAALAEGYRHIDTSRWYGNEEEVGHAIVRSAVPRDEFWLTTKLLHPNSPPMTDLVGELEESLRRLRTEYVDLLLLHWPRPEIDLEWILGEFAQLRDAGKVRAVGVSNFPTGLLQRARMIDDRLLTNQVEYHAFLDQRPMIGLLRSSNMFLTAYAPLARGAVLNEPIIRDIAAAHGHTPAQVALRWSVQQQGVVAVAGAEDVGQMRENLRALTISLDVAEMEAISALHRGHRVVDPAHGPVWDDV